MEKTERFYDFCIPYNKEEEILCAILDESVQLGYKTIAIDQPFDITKKDGAKRGAEAFPMPHNVEHLRKKYHNKLKILQRITIIYVDASITHPMSQSSNLKLFNLIAGQPKTDQALNHCCTTFNGDLITFDSSAGSRLHVTYKSYQIAVQRGLFFEIKYAPAFDSNNRRDMIKIAQNYCVKGKSRNIIFSSGAAHEFQLRGPYDVANLSFIFGLSDDQGKNAIDRCCRQLYLRGESRRLGKVVMFATGINKQEDSDKTDESEHSAEEDNAQDDEFEQPNKKFKLS